MIETLLSSSTVESPPAQAWADLRRHAREGARALILKTNMSEDRAQASPQEELEEARGQTRILGPASGGVFQGDGGVAVLSSIGSLAPAIARAIGVQLGVLIDLGLAWDLNAEGLIEQLAGRYHTLGIALPEDQLRALGPALRRVGGRMALLALVPDRRGPLATSLSYYKVAAVDDLGSFARALAVHPEERLPGRRLAIVTGTGPLTPWIQPAFEAQGFAFPSPSEGTLEELRKQLPLETRVSPLLEIPGATPRHAEVATLTLGNDLRFDAVIGIDIPGFPPRDPHLEAAHYATVVALDESLGQSSAPLVAIEVPERSHAEVAAALIMRATSFGTIESSRLLEKIDSRVRLAGQPVSHVAMAQRVAQGYGYPVALGEVVCEDADALAEAWLKAPLGLPGDVNRLQSDLRMVGPVPSRQWEIHYQRDPLPTLTVDGEVYALPSREREWPEAALAAIFRALSGVSVALTDIVSIRLKLNEEGQILYAKTWLGQLIDWDSD